MNTFKIGDKVKWLRPASRGGPVLAVFKGYCGKYTIDIGYNSAVIDTGTQITTVRASKLVKLNGFEVR